MIHASIPPPASSFPRFAEMNWAALWERMTWRTALLLLLVALLPGGMLLLPFAIASARKPASAPEGRERLATLRASETPIPG